MGYRLHLLLLLSVTTASVSSDSCRNSLLSAAVDALTRGIDFMNHQQKVINLDAVLGCRFAADQLKFLINTLPARVRSYYAYRPVLSKLASIRQKAENVIARSSHYLTKNYPAYFKKLGAVVEPGKWNLSYSIRHVKREFLDRDTLSYEYDPYTNFDSDNCFAELLGTSNESARKCHISDFCWSMLNYHGLKDYSLTHQLLYLLIAEMSDCADELKTRVSANKLRSLEDYLCVNVLRDAEEIAKTGFRDIDQDLFMEQVALCGILGYIDFYKPLWLQRMIAWQRPEGCYATRWIIPQSTNATNSDDRNSNRKRNKRSEVTLERTWNVRTLHRDYSLDVLTQEFQRYNLDILGLQETRWTGKDDCLAHKTSVAISALTVNVRFCIAMSPAKQPTK